MNGLLAYAEKFGIEVDTNPLEVQEKFCAKIEKNLSELVPKEKEVITGINWREIRNASRRRRVNKQLKSREYSR